MIQLSKLVRLLTCVNLVAHQSVCTHSAFSGSVCADHKCLHYVHVKKGVKITGLEEIVNFAKISWILHFTYFFPEVEIRVPRPCRHFHEFYILVSASGEIAI